MASAATHDRVVDTAVGSADDDGLRGLPDDVLLGMLERLVTAGDVRTAAKTCVLSRRWRHLPRYQIPHVCLDVADFYSPADDGWFPAALARARRRKDWRLPYQRHACEGLVQALWCFLAAPPSARVIETLRLKMVLTKYEVLRRAGRLVGEAARTGRIKPSGAVVELELIAEKENHEHAPVEELLGYGARFTQFLRGCPRAFRALTRLAVENLWFGDTGAVTDLVRRCRALEHLSLRCCGFEDPVAEMVVDAPPESRLRTLLCLECDVPGVSVVRAPSLVEFHCGWRLFHEGTRPASFGCTPALKKVTLHYRPYHRDDDAHVGRRLSEFLMLEPDKLEVLTLLFEATKIWMRPEMPKYLRPVLGGLKELRLVNVHPARDLSWALFLLGAARHLETLYIEVRSSLMLNGATHTMHADEVRIHGPCMQIFNHVCSLSWNMELDEDMVLDTACLPPPGFRHRRLKEVVIRRAFHVARDAPFARTVVEMAVNLEKLTLGVEDLGCDGCAAAEARRPVLARSRFRSPGAGKDVDTFVGTVRGGLTTSAQVVVL
ncbi:hypothetical protein D1007_46305 [Hordeum vulgare]|nr:hypothetical protein D1007_46305 [Hordeum vulgare]